MRLFGATPHAVLRMTPQAYSLIARRCGLVSVTPDEAPGSARLAFDELPHELRTRNWVEVCAGNCEGVLDLLKLEGTVSTQAGELASGHFLIITTPRR